MSLIIGSKENLAAALLAIPAELERITAVTEAGFAQFKDGQRIEGHRYRPAGKETLLWGGPGRLVGWSVRAVGGPVSVTLRDSRDPENGDELAVFDVAAGASQTTSLGLPGVSFGEALTIQRVGAGTLVGAVWLGAVD